MTVQKQGYFQRPATLVNSGKRPYTHSHILVERRDKLMEYQKNMLDRLIYGGDYNPEQWLDCPDILEQDLLLMKKAHINTVTLGVFSWSMLEPQEGVFHFEWLNEMIDRLYENGIRVILATPSGSRPRWLADKYPEVLRVREDRVRHLYGERHNHCYTSPAYREKVRIINQKIGRASCRERV